jgi:hypothetical protein
VRRRSNENGKEDPTGTARAHNPPPPKVFTDFCCFLLDWWAAIDDTSSVERIPSPNRPEGQDKKMKLAFQGITPQKQIVILRKSLKSNGYEVEGTCASGSVVARIEGVRVFSAVRYPGKVWSVLAAPGLLQLPEEEQV